ncbi:hypothetical protein CMT41_12295 [Colwellia sp. MT41]|uniref:DUF1413 domain-containing protein n=1 Tax=Colwellia sp. MT41 TaxID=58049 RepID=UPI000717832B|nr:DUF1413 domain-containing protein [Colwellia sp. MT41]ALO35411.1 hypothetical protein CMT41_12295 [Colwellia sp. MT41]
MTTFKAKKQTTLNLNISLPQELVLKLLKEAEKEMIDLSLHIANKLDSSLDEISDDLKLEGNTLTGAIMRAEHLKEGDEFTLKDLFKGDEAGWEDVRSPRSFGRKFKKEMLDLEIAEIAGKKADNKIIYKRTNKAASILTVLKL